jgi:hypothetical protein
MQDYKRGTLFQRIYDRESRTAYKRLVEVIREALRNEESLSLSLYSRTLKKNDLTVDRLLALGPTLNMVWNVPADRLLHLPQATLVACIELTNADAALAQVRSYIDARVRPAQIVIAGDLRRISEDDYYKLFDTGVLLYHVVAGENVREVSERALRPLYENLAGITRTTPVAAANPLTHVPAPATMSLDELNAWLRHYSSSPHLD